MAAHRGLALSVALSTSLCASGVRAQTADRHALAASLGSLGAGLGAAVTVTLLGAAVAGAGDPTARWSHVAPRTQEVLLLGLAGYGAVLGAPWGAVTFGRRYGGHGAFGASLLGALGGATVGAGLGVLVHLSVCANPGERCGLGLGLGALVGLLGAASGSWAGYELSHRVRARETPPRSPWVRWIPTLHPLAGGALVTVTGPLG